MEIANKVKRWDVYDAADHLADFWPALYQAKQRGDWSEVMRLADDIEVWADRLWAMSVRGGEIGPSPYYAKEKK